MKYNKQIPQVKNIGLQKNFHYKNKLGLDKAYESNKSTYIEGDTLYIAGTKGLKDWYDNFTKLPFGLTKHADRYKQADEVLKQNPQVTKLVGHSLSTSVSDELRKQHPEKQLELKALYASPFIDFGNKTYENRFRHRGDLISIFDKGAQVVGGSFNPVTAHDYSGYD